MCWSRDSDDDAARRPALDARLRLLPIGQVCARAQKREADLLDWDEGRPRGRVDLPSTRRQEAPGGQDAGVPSSGNAHQACQPWTASGSAASALHPATGNCASACLTRDWSMLVTSTTSLASTPLACAPRPALLDEPASRQKMH